MNSLLVLDLDGVVVRGHPGGGRWDKDLESDLGLKPETLQTRFFKPHWQSIVTGRAATMDVLKAVWPTLETATTPQALVDYWFAHDSALDAELLSEVAAWRAAGGRVFLATVQEHGRAAYLMRDLGLANHFDAMLYSADLGAAKPDAAFYERAQRRLPAASPADVIFLDDIPANVEAARAFGWTAHHYRGIEDLRAALREPNLPAQL